MFRSGERMRRARERDIVEEANRSKYKRALAGQTDCSEASFNGRRRDLREIHAVLLNTVAKIPSYGVIVCKFCDFIHHVLSVEHGSEIPDVFDGDKLIITYI